MLIPCMAMTVFPGSECVMMVGSDCTSWPCSGCVVLLDSGDLWLCCCESGLPAKGWDGPEAVVCKQTTQMSYQ